MPYSEIYELAQGARSIKMISISITIWQTFNTEAKVSSFSPSTESLKWNCLEHANQFLQFWLSIENGQFQKKIFILFKLIYRCGVLYRKNPRIMSGTPSHVTLSKLVSCFDGCLEPNMFASSMSKIKMSTTNEYVLWNCHDTCESTTICICNQLTC